MTSIHQDRPLGDGRTAIFRHPLVVRLTHWATALSILALLPSGLQILNAHPALYFGDVSTYSTPAAAIVAEPDAQGLPRGYLQVGDLRVETTGLLGVSKDAAGGPLVQAIPRWATLPRDYDIAAARRWHFFFAWTFAISGLVYVAHGLAGGRIRRMLLPTPADLRGFGSSVIDHLRFRFDHGEAARSYNVLQKLTYGAVLFGLLPLMVWTGLAMSPAMDARFHGLSALVGGRQTARTLHFLSAMGVVAFVAVHIAMVIAAGPINQVRSMLTGWFVIRDDKEKAS